VREFDPDGTRRTVLARTALEVSGEAKSGVADVKRTVRHMKWIWGAVVLVGAIFAAGFVARDRLDHYATKLTTDEHETRLNLIEKSLAARDELSRSQTEAIKRLADNFDDLNKFIRERRNGR